MLNRGGLAGTCTGLDNKIPTTIFELSKDGKLLLTPDSGFVVRFHEFYFTQKCIYVKIYFHVKRESNLCFVNIPPNEISAHERVGKTSDGQPVVMLTLVGGLYLVVSKGGGGYKVLGVGSHPAVAKHIASRETDITYDSLAKSEYPIETFADLLPGYIELTKTFQKMQGE